MINFETLASESSGLKIASFSTTFRRLLKKSSQIYMVTGYVSQDSIQVLLSLLEANTGLKSFDLVVGMARTGGLTSSQKLGLEILDSALRRKGMGAVFISWSVPVHAKICWFDRHSVTIGSSNLSGIADSANLFEVDVLLTDRAAIESLNEIKDAISFDLEPFSKVVNQIPVISGSASSKLLAASGVATVTTFPANLIVDPAKSFVIPLKPEVRSHLNSHNAAPRSQYSGPRDWYEVEIGISSSMRALPGFPTEIGLKDIQVITDDGWTFKCHFSGQNGKNLTSVKDLTILGRWIKGRLLDAGVLSEGDLYTNAVAQAYGRADVTLTATNKRDVWILSFEV